MIDEVAYAAHWANIHAKEDKAKELYSMLDQLYTFTPEMTKKDKMEIVFRARARDKIINSEEYRLLKQYIEHGYVY